MIQSLQTNGEVSLKEGTYYLKERSEGNTIDLSLYDTDDELIKGTADGLVKDADGYICWKVELTDPVSMDAEALTKTISLGNYKNEGAVSLEKFHVWTEKALSGAKFTLYQYSVNSEGTGEWTPVSGKTNVTAANGS